MLVQIIDPIIESPDKTVDLTYDDAGRLNTITDRNNESITYAYTPNGKPRLIDYSDPATTDVVLTYTPAWEDLDTMTDSIGLTNYDYDITRRLTSLTDAQGFVVGYDYDAAGNLTTLTYPGNKQVIYTYDALNRVKTVTTWLGDVTTYIYDAAGQLDFVDNFNGTITDYGFDDANRLTSLDHKRADNSVIASQSFPVLDGNGNRTTEVREEPRLPKELADANITYNYNPQKNRLNSTTQDSFSYDDAGQQTDKSGTSHGWDGAHRLTGYGNNQYFYDGADRRLKAVRNGTTTKYIYDASGNLLAEADNAGTILRYYIYGSGLLAVIEGNSTYTYHFNATGHAWAITDATDSIVNTYTYTPYGQLVSEAETITQPFKYVGQYGVQTEPDGLLYMRARYYDPSIGRFISEDPIGFEGGLNLYAYVGGNPTTGIDPSGTFCAPCATYAV